MEIDKHIIKLTTFKAELPEPLDRSLRTLITTEVDIEEVTTKDNGDGTFEKIYKAKVNGTTIVKQGKEKPPILAKSRRSQSAKLRMSIFETLGNNDEQEYKRVMSYIIDNIGDVIAGAKQYLIE